MEVLAKVLHSSRLVKEANSAWLCRDHTNTAEYAMCVCISLHQIEVFINTTRPSALESLTANMELTAAKGVWPRAERSREAGVIILWLS